MRILIIICSLFFCLSANGQYSKISEDFQVWSSVGAEKKIGKKTLVSIRHDLRLKQNASNVKSYFAQGGVEREITKLIYAGFNLRITNYGDNPRYRISPLIVFGKRIKKIRLGIKYRTRFDYNFDDQKTESEWRNRLLISYRKKGLKWRPSFGVELFLPDENNFSLLSKVRYISKLRYDLSNQLKVSMGFLIQEEKNRERPGRDYVTQLSLNYTID